MEYVPKVSVIIINFNGREHLVDCLDSLAAQIFTNFETILVDNGSQDGSLELIKNSYPWVHLLVLDQNYGFAEANNRAIDTALGDYVALLNNDTITTSSWLKEMVDVLDTRPDIAFCASKLIFFYNPALIDSAGDELYNLGVAYSFRNFPIDHPKVSQKRMCLSACAAASFYRRSLFNQIGGFDTLFSPAYFEDVDLGMRAQWYGLRCLYVPSAVVLHKGGATSGKRPLFQTYLTSRNIEILLLKNMPMKIYLLNLPLRAIYFLFSLFRKKPIYGWWALKAKIDFIQQIPAVLRKKATIKKKVRSEQITHMLLRFPYLDKGRTLFKKQEKFS